MNTYGEDRMTACEVDIWQQIIVLAFAVLAVLALFSTPAFASDGDVLAECVENAGIAAGVTAGILWLLVPGVGFFASILGGLAGVGPIAFVADCTAHVLTS